MSSPNLLDILEQEKKNKNRRFLSTTSSGVRQTEQYNGSTVQRNDSHEKRVTSETFLQSIIDNPTLAPEEIDLVISGGGMKAYFVIGAYSILSQLPYFRVCYENVSIFSYRLLG